MTTHLSPQEFVEAIEGTLVRARLDHLSACGECQAGVTELRDLLANVEAARPVPEPSPLFWDHFSARVRAATTAAPPPARSWWAASWRPFATALGAAGAVAIALLLRPVPPVATPSEPVTATAVAESPLDEGSWDLVMGIASGLPYSDVESVARPRQGTADAVIDDLTPAQRELLAKMLRAEIGTEN
jgi:hypothetical protein